MASVHTLPSLRDILNPTEDGVGSGHASKTPVVSTSANCISQPQAASPLAESSERHQPQLYHSHSVPGPPSFEAAASASPIRHTRYGSPGTEDLFNRTALTNLRNTSLPSEFARHHQVAAIPPHRPSPRVGASDHLLYTLQDRMYQPDALPPSLRVETRSLDNSHFPGDDRYWSYPDSLHVRKYASGECVNPQWGITKAGKPRKRLAQACTTCREKKIKCDPMVKNDPGTPKCAQCQKFGRECRFENGPRNSSHHAAVPLTHEPVVSSDRATTPEFTVNTWKKSNSIPQLPEQDNSINGKSNHDTSKPSPGHPENLSRLNKRPKIETDLKSDTGVAESIEPNEYREDSPRWNIAEGKHGTTLWDFDPYEVDSESCCHYLELYFTHINRASYCIFAKEPFMEWVRTSNNKSSLERMLIYSLLAMGTIFSSRDYHKRDGRQFATVAKYGLDKNLGNFTLTLVQSRLILGLYYFAIGDAGKAWDLAGGGLRGASALKLNLESSVRNIRENHLDFGYTKAGVIECRRRTFWSAYIMDRFNGFCSGHLSVIQNDDCLLRLPIHEHIYESQGAAETPFFENDNVDPALSSEADRSQLGAMGYHAQASSLWGEVLANIYRSSHRREYDYSEKYEEFYARLNRQLDQWMDSLPAELTNTQENTDRSIREGYIGTYIGLHTLYHAALMKLNRHCRWKLLSPASVERNIQKAHYHATEVLSIVQTLSRTDRKARLPDVEFAFSTPFTSYSVLTAVDILSAAGRLEDLPKHGQLLEGSLEVVAELAGFWSIARRHKSTILRRIKDISDAAQDPVSDKQVFAMDNPMDTTFPKEEDVIYAVPRGRLYKSLGIDEGLVDDQKILWVEASYEGGIGYI